MNQAGLQRGKSNLGCRLLLIALLFMSARPVNGVAEVQRWTLEQCLEHALAHSADIHEAQADIRIAKSQLARAKAGRFPRVTFTSINGIITGAEGNAVNGDTIEDDYGPFTRGELEFVQPLFSFGRIRSEIRAAASGVDTKRAAARQTRGETIVAVKELYYNLLLSRQVRELLGEVQDNFTTAIETVTERLEAGEGTITQQDVLKLRIGFAGVSREVYKLERAVEVTRGALLLQLGLPPDASVDIADTRLQPVTIHLQPFAHYLAQAGVRRPEIAQVEAGVSARRARLKAAQSEYYPAFFLAGGLRYAEAPNRAKQNSPFANDDFNFFSPPGAALGVRWQLDFWSTHAKVEERLAQLSKVKIQKQRAVAGIVLDIQRRYLEVQEAQKQIVTAQKARRAARALLVTTLTNFNLGIGEGKDVFESLGLYAKSVSDYYATVRDHNLAAARLSQASGEEIATPTVTR